MSAVTVRTPDSGFENLDRRYESAGRLVPFLLLVVPLIPYVLTQAPSAGAAGITLAVAAAAGAWVTWRVILHPGPPRRPWHGYVYFAGLLVFIAVLTVRSPWFAFFTWIGFLHAGQYLAGAWRWAGSAVVAVFIAMAQRGDSTGRPRRWALSGGCLALSILSSSESSRCWACRLEGSTELARA